MLFSKLDVSLRKGMCYAYFLLIESIIVGTPEIGWLENWTCNMKSVILMDLPYLEEAFHKYMELF